MKHYLKPIRLNCSTAPHTNGRRSDLLSTDGCTSYESWIKGPWCAYWQWIVLERHQLNKVRGVPL